MEQDSAVTYHDKKTDVLRIFQKKKITAHGHVSNPIKVDKKRTSLCYF